MGGESACRKRGEWEGVLWEGVEKGDGVPGEGRDRKGWSACGKGKGEEGLQEEGKSVCKGKGRVGEESLVGEGGEEEWEVHGREKEGKTGEIWCMGKENRRYNKMRNRVEERTNSKYYVVIC